MTIIVAQDTPDRIRGILKRWFIEPKPNVFVGNINIRICANIVEYLRRESKTWNAMIFVNGNNIQGYKIITIGKTNYSEVNKCGYKLIATKIKEE